MKTVRVEAGRPYDVMIGYGLLSMLGEAILARHKRCRVALIADETTFRLYGEKVRKSLADAGFTAITCLIPSGEATKSLRTVDTLLVSLAQAGLTRSDLIVALGGGVTGDVAGFTASIYLRGIDYVQVPTTLLAAVDSSIGGKTGVNLPQGKNLVGAFWQPSLVLCDCDAFATLPRETFLDGVAESLKYGMLCDRALFEKISSGALDENCLDTIARCVEIKAEHVAGDERDKGKRQLLNLGHTMGHAIEVLSDYSVSHGHAVAIGMVGAARIAEGLGKCVMGCAGIVMAMLDRLGLPSETAFTADALASVALRDKKRDGDTVTLILPDSIGHCALYPVPASQIQHMFHLATGGR